MLKTTRVGYGMSRRTPQKTRAYGADLALIHDIGFTEFTQHAASYLLALLRKAGKRAGRIVDLGCGPGTLAKRLVDSGFDVLGIDISPAMVRLARKQVKRARFVCGSYRNAVLPECDTVTAIGEIFNYKFDRRAGLTALRRIFRRVHAALRPGGLFLFDVSTPGRGGPGGLRFAEGPTWATIVRVKEDSRRRVLRREIVSFLKRGSSYRRSEETHDLTLYRRAEVARELRAAGFSVRMRESYGPARLPFGWVIFEARK
jgi:SAM-dependent methyltransferase